MASCHICVAEEYTVIRLKFKEYNAKDDFIKQAKVPGLYICTLGVYVGYIGISENVSSRWFTDNRENHNTHPHKKWKPLAIKGLAKDTNPFSREVDGQKKKMKLYVAGGKSSINTLKNRQKRIVDLSEQQLRAGIESLLIYKQSQVNKQIQSVRTYMWGSSVKTKLSKTCMLLNKDHTYTGNPKGPDTGKKSRPRNYLKYHFSQSKIEIEGLSSGRIKEMRISNVGIAVNNYVKGEKIL